MKFLYTVLFGAIACKKNGRENQQQQQQQQ
jgi:hypothetical protein